MEQAEDVATATVADLKVVLDSATENPTEAVKIATNLPTTPILISLAFLATALEVRVAAEILSAAVTDKFFSVIIPCIFNTNMVY